MSVKYKNKDGQIVNVPTSGSTTQIDTFPAASASNVGTIYQYTGTTTSNYIKGYFYQSTEDSSTNPSTYSWVNVNVQAGGSGGQTIQVDTLPTASTSLEGNIYQYVGASTLTLTNGYFYKCVEGETTGTYEWIEVQVQEGGSGGAIEHITLNGVEQPITNKTVALTVIDNTVNNLVNYYKKTETYTQTEVNNLISAAAFGGFQVVSSLPTQDISTKTIYLVAKTVSETNNVYDEFIYVNNQWESIGDTEIDLSVYQTKNLSSPITVGGVSQTTVEAALSAINALFASYMTTSAFNTTISDYYTKAQVDTTTGSLSNLATTNKTNLVSAINELNAAGRPRSEVVISAATGFRSAGQGSYSFKTSAAVTITLADANTITIPANIQGIFDVGETDATLNDYIGLIQYTLNGYEKKIYFTSSVFYLPATDSVQIDDTTPSSSTTYSSSKIETVIGSAKASQMTGATSYQDGKEGLATKPVAGDNQKALFGDGQYHTIYSANTGSTIVVTTDEPTLYGRTVTLTAGSTTLTGTLSNTGECTFTNLALYGAVNISATDSEGNPAKGSTNISYFGTYVVGIGFNFATIKFTSSDITLAGTPVAVYFGNNVVAETSLASDGQGGLEATCYVEELGNYKAIAQTSGGTARANVRVLALHQTYTVALIVANIYGFKINKADSDPATCVTPYDLGDYDVINAGFTPVHMDYTNDVFDYGSWAALETCDRSEIFFAPKPCMLNYDGTVAYYLDPTDFTKKADGTASDIADDTFGGNAMVEFPTVWFKRWTDSNYNYVLISDKQIDLDFHAYAHHDINGHVLDNIYISAYELNTETGGKTRSLSGKAPNTALSPNACIQGAALNNDVSEQGEGWTSIHKSDYDMLVSLLLLISSSTNSQASYGGGVSSGSVPNNGSADAKGMFYGSNNTTTPVKVFGISDLWASGCKCIIGWCVVNSKHKIKMTYGKEDGSDCIGFNTTANGYVEVNGVYNTGGAIKEVSMTEYGFVPTAVGASSTTYFCDTDYNGALGIVVETGNTVTNGAGSGLFGATYRDWGTANYYPSGLMSYKGIVT